MTAKSDSQNIEQWGLFELTLPGPSDGNPFVEVELSAEFRHQHRGVTVDGFYDGAGMYRIRFMPDTLGHWTYTTYSNRPELHDVRGAFACTAPSPDNHGPVVVKNRLHFSYADDHPYVPVGTTSYVWNHQGEALEAQTLETLRTAPFNKMRMCVFPKDYLFNQNEPEHYPFEGKPLTAWDFSRFSPVFFHHLERRVGDLLALGIEADLILFHPYDRWGFSRMSPEADDRYLRYVVARLAAYRNVWWSMANEFDLMLTKDMTDWDRFFKIVQTHDPYQHLRSVHNCRGFYDHAKPWVTHCSVQRSETFRIPEWHRLYGKPVVVDECCYEGNIDRGWGNIPALELVHRFWDGFARGGYVGHGETYVHAQDILWWSKGGVLHGESPARIAFLRQIMEAAPSPGLDTTELPRGLTGGYKDEYFLYYTGRSQPSYCPLELPGHHQYQADVIDIWEMTVTPIDGIFSGSCRVDLPGKPYVALRLQKIG
jgi:hypothetical protein